MTTSTTSTPTIDEAIAEYCRRLTDSYRAHVGSGPYFENITIEHIASDGKVYARISRRETHNETKQIVSHSAVAFVKRDDGSVWKPASWKAPAKNFARLNVFNLPERPMWSL